MAYRSYFLGLGWVLVLLVVGFSLAPNPPDTGVDQGDKIGHLLAYFCLMAWWGQLHDRHPRLLVLFLLLGAALEGLQGLTPSREPSLFDMLANASGALLGWLATRIWPHWLPVLDARLASRPTS